MSPVTPRPLLAQFHAILPAVMLAVLSLIVGACSSGEDGARISELEAQVTRLEADLESARAAIATDSATPAPGVPLDTEPVTRFGFTLTVPSGVPIVEAGTADPDPTAAAGQITTSDGSVVVSLLWATADLTPEEAVIGAFDLLRAAAADRTLHPTNQGVLSVDDRVGAFGAFQVQDSDAVEAVGIVGGWSCDERSFALTILGADVDAVEDAFAGLIEGFACDG
jgi:outer membrane murein-binding lipoprotein Lpp